MGQLELTNSSSPCSYALLIGKFTVAVQKEGEEGEEGRAPP